MKATLLDDMYRGTDIWIGIDGNKLLAVAKGNGANMRAVYHRTYVDVQGSAPQPVVDRINEATFKFRRMPIMLPEGF